MQKIGVMIFCFIPILSNISCSNEKPDLKYVKESQWVWDTGFRIGKGDFVEFGKSDLFQLFSDTITYRGKPVCTVISTDQKMYSMTVKSISGEIGFYADTREFTK
jgi:hypothetical protein